MCSTSFIKTAAITGLVDVASIDVVASNRPKGVALGLPNGTAITAPTTSTSTAVTSGQEYRFLSMKYEKTIVGRGHTLLMIWLTWRAMRRQHKTDGCGEHGWAHTQQHARTSRNVREEMGSVQLGSVRS